MRFSVPVMLSALFFSCMHLVLIATGARPMAIYVVMVFTFFLGLVAAYQREKSDSVLPPIVAHISFNVGGVIGALLFVIAQLVIFGKSAQEVAKIIVG
jgi:membrane protease YdiL (CAAX protease family)